MEEEIRKGDWIKWLKNEHPYKKGDCCQIDDVDGNNIMLKNDTWRYSTFRLQEKDWEYVGINHPNSPNEVQLFVF